MARALIGHREWHQKDVRLGFGLATVLVVMGALVTLLPFVWMLLTSVRPPQDLFQFPARWLPSRWDFSAYQQALGRLPLGRYFLNTVLVSLATVAGQLALSAPAAYALARLKPRYATFWALLVAATLMVPVETLVVPLYLQLRSFPFGVPGGFNLLDTLAALVLPGIVSAFNIFVLRGFFSRLPSEILDSAKIDGCSEWGVFFRFVLPLSKPILTVLGIFGFIAAWNAFFWPLVALSDPGHYTLMLGLQKMLETGEPWNIVMAAVTLATLPSLAVFLAFQRWISRGLAFSRPLSVIWDESGLSRRLKVALKNARFGHTKGVVKTADRLARRHGVDPARARLAAWLHDCGKGLERDAMRPLLRRAGADAQELLMPPLWHAPVGALLARRDYGLKDAEILRAIRFHSTGAPDQTPLQKVLFVADYIEPGRPLWAELPALRRLADRDLHAAWGQALRHKLLDLLERERPLHPRSLAAYHAAFKKP